jgi:hypothetical protein
MDMYDSEYWKNEIETPEVKKSIHEFEKDTGVTITQRERVIFQFGYIFGERNTRRDLYINTVKRQEEI